MADEDGVHSSYGFIYVEARRAFRKLDKASGATDGNQYRNDPAPHKTAVPNNRDSFSSRVICEARMAGLVAIGIFSGTGIGGLSLAQRRLSDEMICVDFCVPRRDATTIAQSVEPVTSAPPGCGLLCGAANPIALGDPTAPATGPAIRSSCDHGCRPGVSRAGHDLQAPTTITEMAREDHVATVVLKTPTALHDVQGRYSGRSYLAEVVTAQATSPSQSPV